jgi:putative colanic acid biosynthesis acetyltransferase WcaF
MVEKSKKSGSSSSEWTIAPDPPAIRDERYAWSIAEFPGYDKGRGKAWQAGWWLTLNLVFKPWWCPARVRAWLLRQFGATVGSGVFIREQVHLLWPWHLTIGDDVWIGRGATLLTSTKITLGHDVCISQDAMLLSSGHNPLASGFDIYDFPITVGDHVWVCARAMLLHGARVPPNTVVAANRVVAFGHRVPEGDAP